MASDRVHKARLRTHMTPGEMVRTVRELQEMTQVELAVAAGITQGALSAIETGRVEIGVERARRLGQALRVHPAVLLFPDLEDDARAPTTRGTAGPAAVAGTRRG
jgi:transcriptional regulator with XRE-family HTH domain